MGSPFLTWGVAMELGSAWPQINNGNASVSRPLLKPAVVALERHGNRLTIVEHVDELLPHRFDLILMLDVLEHLPDPFTLFFSLFNKGAIGPETLVYITTPNAGNFEAVADPVSMGLPPPAAHLVFIRQSPYGFFCSVSDSGISISREHTLCHARLRRRLTNQSLQTKICLGGEALSAKAAAVTLRLSCRSAMYPAPGQG